MILKNEVRWRWDDSKLHSTINSAVARTAYETQDIKVTRGHMLLFCGKDQSEAIKSKKPEPGHGTVGFP